MASTLNIFYTDEKLNGDGEYSKDERQNGDRELSKDEPASSGDSGDESGSEPDSPGDKLRDNTYKSWTNDAHDRDSHRESQDNIPSTSSSNPEPESSKAPSLAKILPKIELPGGAMLYPPAMMAGMPGLENLGTNLGLGNLGMGYPPGFILSLPNQTQDGASSSSTPQFITIPLSMAMPNGCSSDDSSELQDLSTGGRK